MKQNMSYLIRLILLLFIGTATLQAQETNETKQAAYLFPGFTEGRILLKNKLNVRTKFNYNCIKQALYFLDRDQEMIMDNTDNVDTLYIQGRKFIPYQTRFLECIPLATADYLLVDWRARAHNIGKKGAMGLVTQAGGIDKVDVSYLQHTGKRDRTSNDVYNIRYENAYFIQLDGKRRRFTHLKSFLKLYPKEQQATLEKFAKEEKIDFADPQQVARLVSFIADK